MHIGVCLVCGKDLPGLVASLLFVPDLKGVTQKFDLCDACGQWIVVNAAKFQMAEREEALVGGKSA